MNQVDIALLRLQQQQLASPVYERAEQVVGWLGALQAQDYGMAKWAVAQRTKSLTNADLDRAFDRGEILRTHVLRPTWHFVTPADIRWLQTLTAEHNRQASALYFRRLEVDERQAGRSRDLLVQALQGGKQLTRPELGQVLQAGGLDTHNLLRLTYLVIWAELDGLLCSGSRRGKQFTYALLDERAPQAGQLDREQALAELTRRYFISRGPATAEDFMWWSGLNAGQVNAGLALAGADLAQAEVDGKSYWFAAGLPDAAKISPAVYLLSILDEYIIAYRDRKAALDGKEPVSSIPRGAILFNPTLVIDGRVAGVWKRVFNKGRVLLSIIPFGELSLAEEQALEPVLERYGEFCGQPVVLRKEN